MAWSESRLRATCENAPYWALLLRGKTNPIALDPKLIPVQHAERVSGVKTSLSYPTRCCYQSEPFEWQWTHLVPMPWHDENNVVHSMGGWAGRGIACEERSTRVVALLTTSLGSNSNHTSVIQYRTP